MSDQVLLLLVGIGLLSLVSQWLAWYMRVPAILFLLGFHVGGKRLSPIVA